MLSKLPRPFLLFVLGQDLVGHLVLLLHLPGGDTDLICALWVCCCIIHHCLSFVILPFANSFILRKRTLVRTRWIAERRIESWAWTCLQDKTVHFGPIKPRWITRHVAIGSRATLDAVKPTLWRLHFFPYLVLSEFFWRNTILTILYLGCPRPHLCSPLRTKRAQGCSSEESSGF